MVIHSRQQGFGMQVADSRTRGYTNGTSQSLSATDGMRH